jgi:hypothetical protein
MWLHMEFEVEDGSTEPHAICVHSDDQAVQDRGTKLLERLSVALGVQINEPSDVIGIPLLITADDDFRALEAA